MKAIDLKIIFLLIVVKLALVDSAGSEETKNIFLRKKINKCRNHFYLKNKLNFKNNINFSKDFECVDFSGKDLTSFNFNKVNFTHANLENVNLNFVSLRYSNLSFVLTFEDILYNYAIQQSYLYTIFVLLDGQN